MEKQQLKATRRTVLGKHVARLRRAGSLPAVLYGPSSEPVALQLDTREASRIFRRVHGAQLIDLEVDGKTYPVLVHDLQRDAIRGDFLHADFYAVDMNRTLRVRVPIHLVGSSYAVTSLSGVLVRGLTELEIECLPVNLIENVDADLGELKEIGSALHVRDLYVPKTVRMMSDPDDMIARVTYQTKEEDLTTPAAPTTTEVEVIERGKVEEGEEGEAEAE